MTRRTRCSIAIPVAVVVAAAAVAAPLVRAQTTISYNGGTYTQNFVTLPNSGTFTLVGAGPHEFAGAPIFAFGMEGWTHAKTSGTGTLSVFRVSSGTNDDGAVYSFGATSTVERALGSVASGAVGSTFGATFVNTGLTTLNQFTLSYTGEQWRRGGSGNANTLGFSYALGASSILDSAGSFTNVASLSFTSPVTAGAASALNGNDPANQASIAHTVGGLTWAPGERLVVRWKDIDDPGSDDGLGIDNLSFSARFAPPARSLVWNPLGAGTVNWSTNPANTNWLDGAASASFNNGDVANFTDAGVGSVVIDAAGVAPGNVIVSNNSGIYQFHGGPITGSAALEKAGSGTLLLTAANTYTGGTILNGGFLDVGADDQLGAASGSILFGVATLNIVQSGFISARSVQINNVAGINTNAHDATFSGIITGSQTWTKSGSGRLSVTNLRIGGLNIAAGEVRSLAGATPALPAGVSKVGSLLIAGGPAAPAARLDLTNNAMIVTSTASAPAEGSNPTLDDIAGYIRAAYGAGSWSGNGITTSLGDGTNFGLGYDEFTAAGTFLGQPVAPGDVAVRFTRYGDANIDGNVNLQDFNRLASNFGLASGAVWSQGDFNYDGIVNLQDFNRLAANFGLQAGPDGPTPEDWAALASAVPEPGAALVAFAAAAPALLRRGRRQVALSSTAARRG